MTTDAHSTGALAYAEFGLGQARRAWLTKEQVLNTRPWAEIAKAPLSTFREDGAAALEWVAAYLDGIREQRPVLADVEPGAIAAALPAAPPEAAEPFASVLRDLDEVLRPGLTHWQSPRYFAYFPSTAAEPGILAELLIAGLNQVGILWRASPALQELEEVTLDWVRQLLGLPEPLHGHLEDTASTGLITALAAARAAAPGPARRRLLRAHALVDREGRAPARARGAARPRSTARTRCAPTRSTSRDACAVVATVGTTSSDRRRPGGRDRRPGRGGGRLAPRRCRLRRRGSGLPRAAAPLRRLGAGGLDRVNPHKWLFTPMDCSVFFCRRPDDLRRAFSLVPEYLRVAGGGRQPERVRRPARPALPRAEALGDAALLRPRRAAGDLFASTCGWPRSSRQWVEREPGLGALRADAASRSSASAGSAATRTTRRCMRRVNASGEIFLSHTRLDGRFVLRLAIGNARTSEADVALAWDVLRREAARLTGESDPRRRMGRCGSSSSASSPGSSAHSSASAAAIVIVPLLMPRAPSGRGRRRRRRSARS